jgi:hypothetical protein
MLHPSSMRSAARRAGFVLLLIAAMVFGMVSHAKNLPPTRMLRTLWTTAAAVAGVARPDAPSSVLPAEPLAQLADDLIELRTPADVARHREQLAEFLWDSTRLLPSTRPAVIDEGETGEGFLPVSGAVAHSVLRVEMEFGLDSIAYHLHPASPNGEVVIFHEGHAGWTPAGRAVIEDLLARGYAVVAMAMPLTGPNSRPVVPLRRIGTVQLLSHNQMAFLQPEAGHPVKYFIEPVIAVLNHFEQRFGSAGVSMMGVSGGGWTTILAAALDTRIRTSVPVAGSYPIYVRAASPRDWGDFEQVVPELYRISNYLELYVLGASGPGRRQVTVVNEFDPCCFAGRWWEGYHDAVSERVTALGPGRFEVLLDSTHVEHMLSPAALQWVVQQIRAPHGDEQGAHASAPRRPAHLPASGPGRP